MANIVDYIKAHGGYRINRAAPFNELDAMVLSRFSYLPFHKIRLKRRDTIYSIAQKMSALDVDDFAWPEDSELIQAMGLAPRFSSFKTTHYVKKSSAKIAEQFMAITIHISKTKMFISYIGTDSSLHGWREDFNLALMNEIPSQISGAKYLKKVARRYFWKKLYLGGHSKGGNIAMYSAIVVRDFYQNRIISVCSLDGPGMTKKIVDQDLGRSVMPRIKNFIPQDSIIGRLLNHTETFEVVKSNAKNFWQHNIYSWEIDLENKCPVRSESTPKSDFVDKTIDRWIQSASQEQREVFVDLLFRMLEVSKLGTPVDVAAAGFKAIPTFFKAYHTLSRDDRKVITSFIKKLLISAFTVYQENRASKK
ncbi:DUF2974 domain-containing protein [Candidatus Saccharibacteria bacterium]|nr:DUF2974 domain-containing protein [Candidatus Saccharibacteria bacterium]